MILFGIFCLCIIVFIQSGVTINLPAERKEYQSWGAE